MTESSSSSGVKSLFPSIEEEIREYWKKNNIFEKSLNVGNKSEDCSEKSTYVFYDGPPFANGLPHYGHLLTGFVKDSFARYHTMLGEKTERRFGWDCHGLPAEMQSEKELKIHGRKEIKKYGIEKFNKHCSKSVLHYVQEWKDYVKTQSRWVDFDNGYKTMDKDYMESVLWGFKELYKKGLIYEEYRVMPYSWQAQTPLSNFEIQLDNSYRKKNSKSIYVKFEIKDVPKSILKKFDSEKSFFFIVWTTTPWTLPSNLALAVNKDLKYTLFEYSEKEVYIISENLLENVIEEIKSNKKTQ